MSKVVDFVGISDVHINLKNIEVSLNVLEQALALANQSNIPLLIAGDLNDTKAILRSEYIKDLMDLFDRFSMVSVIIMVGNHDLNNKASNDHSLEFLRKHSNITIVDSPVIMDFNTHKWALVPYFNSDVAFLKCIDELKASGVKNVVTHQGYFGAFMGDYVVDKSSVSPDVMSDFNVVLSGHYHKHQTIGNITYFGSPFTVDFSESNQPKYIWNVSLLPSGMVDLEGTLTNVRRHYQFDFEGVIPDSISPIPEDSLVKVIAKGSKEFALSIKPEDLTNKFGWKNITIVPEIIKHSELRMSSEMMNDPIKVIKNYLLVAKTDFDKSSLEKYFFETVSEIINNNINKSNVGFKVANVEWENFLSYENGKFDFLEKRGLTSVEGFDQDNGVNTGTGKSSFLDAPCYGIFGKTSKKLKSDEVINRRAGKNLYIKTDVIYSSGSASIIRYKKHKEFGDDLFMVLPSGKTLRGKDNRETQKFIEQELSCDFDMFLRASYFTQFSNIDRFLSASDSEKKKIVSEISDQKIFDHMLDCIKDDLKINKKLWEQKNTDFLVSQNSLSLTTKSVYDKKITKAFWDNKNTELIATIKGDIQNFDLTKINNLTNLESTSANFQQVQINEVQRIQALIDNHSLDVANQISTLQEQQRVHEEQDVKEVELIKASIVSKQRELKVTKDLVDSFIIDASFDDKINTLLQSLSPKENSVMLDIQHNVSNTSNISTQLTAINEQISNLDNKNLNSPCPFCFQDLSSEHLEKHRNILSNNLQSILSTEDSLLKEAIELQLVKDSRDRIMTEVDNITNQKRDYESNMKVLSNNKILMQSQKEAIELLEISINNRPKTNYESLILQAQNAVSPYVFDLQAEQNKINPYTEQIKVEQSTINPSLQLLDIAENSINPHIADITNLINQEQIYTKSFNELKEQLFTIQTKVDYASWWKDALHIYIKSYLMDSFLCQLNEVANSNLDDLFNGLLKIDISSTTEKGGQIKEKVNVIIYNAGEECSYESLSGGERCRICFAVNLAVRSIITQSNTGAFNYLALDEVLNGLDETGKNQTMRLLKNLEEEISTIFMIDHTEEFKQMFNSSVSIVKKSGISTIL